MYDFEFILGAILFTFIISRLFTLVFLWFGQPGRLIFANLATLASVMLLRAHGMSINASPDYTEALTAYSLPVFLWLVFDFYRWRRAGKKTLSENSQ